MRCTRNIRVHVFTLSNAATRTRAPSQEPLGSVPAGRKERRDPTNAHSVPRDPAQRNPDRQWESRVSLFIIVSVMRVRLSPRLPNARGRHANCFRYHFSTARCANGVTYVSRGVRRVRFEPSSWLVLQNIANTRFVSNASVVFSMNRSREHWTVTDPV